MGADARAGGTNARPLPLAFKLTWLGFVAVLVPVYIAHHGLVNFLWFSNVALLVGLLAAWTESARLASMMTVSVLLMEMGWIFGFLSGLARGGEPLLGLAGYMFDPEIPRYVRALSLYHLALPAALLWMVWRLGYDRVAWRLWIPIGWTVLVVTWLIGPQRNINWVHGPLDTDFEALVPEVLWLLGLMAACAVIWWLTHRAVEWLLALLPEISGVGRAACKPHGDGRD